MASILNNSSFLFNPAGSIIAYEEDKVFSVLPNDGTVDGAVGGNSGGGTRVNQQGYIETVPANINTYSEKFGPGYWNTYNGTITDNTVAAPNGTVTGATFNGSPAGAYKTFTGITVGQVYTVSMYVRLGTATNCVIVINNTINWNTVGGQSYTSADGLNTDTWTRISRTFTGPASGQINWHIGYHFESGITPQSNGTYFVWGAMLNIGSTALPYQPTTDRLGYPPIDYKNGKGKLLQEPQRTNLTQGSNGLTTNWTNYRGTYTANNITSPDGTVNAPRTVWDGSSPNAVGFYFQNFSFAGSTTYCFSVFLKYYNKPIISVGYVDRSGPFLGGNAYFNVANGTFVSVDGSATTGIIEPYQNGWYRCTVVFTTAASPSFNYLSIDSGAVVAGEGFYVYGSQLEVGSFPTSYIPTTSATVTRATNDVVFYSPGPTKAFATKPGVILYDFDFYNFDGGARYDTFLYSTGAPGGDYFYFANLGGSGQIYWDGNNNGGYFYAGSFVPKQGKNKVAWYFTNTNSYWYVNGNLLYTGTYFDTSYFPYMQTYAVPGNNFAINTFASIPDTSISQAQVQAWTNFNSGSGGTISYSGPYTVHTFTGSATFTPSFSGQVEVLVVAGGGSGGVGSNGGGGGGAGGLLYISSYGVSQGTGVTITVGAGGPYTNGRGAGTNGSNSVFGGLTTIGGGGGGGAAGGPSAGKTGGSGGGGQYPSAGGSGTTGQGNNGGDGNYYLGGIHDAGGGGGGAGASGLNATATNAGNGGDGLPYSISGFSTYYAGGGGGSSNNQSGTGPFFPGNGGLGGGGKGGIQGTTLLGTDGVDGLGAGGGAGVGSAGGASGAGGDGIIIIRYLT